MTGITSCFVLLGIITVVLVMLYVIDLSHKNRHVRRQQDTFLRRARIGISKQRREKVEKHLAKDKYDNENKRREAIWSRLNKMKHTQTQIKC